MDPHTVERVLVYRLGSLGDTIVALPALHLIERAFPSARRLLLTNIPIQSKAPSPQAILDGSDLINGYLSYPVGTRSPRELLRLRSRIRSFNPQVLVYLMPSRGERVVRRDARFFRLCGIRNLIGLPLGDLANNRFDPASGLWESEAERLLRCLLPLGQLDADDLANWDLRLTPAEVQKARDTLASFAGAPLIACGPGTKMQAKDWGQENWRELLSRLGTRLSGRGLVLLGAKEDAGVGDYAAANWPGPVKNLCGLLTPRETAAVLKHTELFLGPDSGPMHAAAACGVPCAIVFSARNDPGIWFPVGQNHRIIYHNVPCRNCGLETCIVSQRVCLSSITIDEAHSAATEAWNNGQRKRDSHPS